MLRDFKIIVDSVNTCIRQIVGPAFPIQFPGAEFDSEQYETWINPIVTMGKPRIQPRGNNPREDIMILVHIFHRYGSNLTEIHTTGTILRNGLHMKDIPFIGVVGCNEIIRCREAEYAFHSTGQTKTDTLETATVRVEAVVE